MCRIPDEPGLEPRGREAQDEVIGAGMALGHTARRATLFSRLLDEHASAAMPTQPHGTPVERTLLHNANA